MNYKDGKHSYYIIPDIDRMERHQRGQGEESYTSRNANHQESRKNELRSHSITQATKN